MKKILLIVALLPWVTYAAGDAAAGKVKYGMCASCHGAKGIAIAPIYPNLAGQQEAYTIKQLKDFKSGARKDAMMNGLAKALSDKDIANIAAYIKSLK